MYKLGFLTLVLSAVSAQVICEDNGLDKCVVPVSTVSDQVICDDNGVDGTCDQVICDDNGVDGTCISTSTSSTSTSTTGTLTTGLNSSSGRKNSVMYIFGLLPLLFI